MPTRRAWGMLVLAHLLAIAAVHAAAGQLHTIGIGDSIAMSMPGEEPDRYRTTHRAVFRLETPRTETVTIDVHSLDFDADLYVYRAGRSENERHLAMDWNSGSGADARVVLKVEAGASYDLEVDRYNNICCGGEFEISVTAGEPPLSPAMQRMAPQTASREEREPMYWQAVEDRARRIDTPACWAYAWGMRAEMLELAVLGRWDRHLELMEDVVRVLEEHYGPDHEMILNELWRRGRALGQLGFLVEAVSDMQRTLELQELVFGPSALELRDPLSSLVGLHRSLGQYAEALGYYERLVAIGDAHPDNWQNAFFRPSPLLLTLGRYDEAREAYQAADEMSGKNQLWPTGLGRISFLEGKYEEALEHYSRALVLVRQLWGSGGPSEAVIFVGLAQVHHALGNLAEARATYERALSTYEAKGLEIQAAGVQRLLAELLMEMGRAEEAAPLLTSSVKTVEKELGADVPEMARGLHAQARLTLATGDRPGAFTDALRAESIEREMLRLTIRSLGEERAMQYAAARSVPLDLVLSILASEPGAVPDGARRAWDAVTRSRAVILDEMAYRRQIVLDGAPQVAALHQKVVSTSSRLAHLKLTGPGPSGSLAKYARLLREAGEENERSERALAENSRPFANEKAQQTIGFDDVVAHLPTATALVAFVHFELQPRAAGRSRPEGSAPEPWYAAFVLRDRQSDPVVISLGSARDIDALVRSWKAEISSPSGGDRSYREEAEALRRKVWDPIATRIRSSPRVLLVPDGSLSMLSFASLPSVEGKYLIETGPEIHLLAAERDLTRFLSRRRARGGRLLALGGADFDTISVFGASAGATSPPVPAGFGTPTEIGGPSASRSKSIPTSIRSSCGDFLHENFETLPFSRLEADDVSTLWSRIGTVETLTGADASELEFKRKAPGKSILHLATHGFFLGGNCASSAERARGLGAVTTAGRVSLPATKGESPLLLSGLILAGANHRMMARPDEDDGILTAREIAGMDLSGVSWAVLSACDTGSGEIRAGEGVFGLRRAFQVAGAETLIMSLWPVEDESARQWMHGLYEARIKGADTADAVRITGLRMLEERRSEGRATHPFYWAAFVASGDFR